ncbi:MAG: hypothetical protein ACP5NW_04395 [Candidatus Woesearchaeota archaeon]
MNTYTLHNTLIYTNSISQQSYLPAEYTFKYDDKVRHIERKKSMGVSLSKEINVPLSILAHNSSLEAIVLYLKDSLGMRFKQISDLLNRDQRTIWVTYANAKKKSFVINTDNYSQIVIPLDVLSSRNLSILESIVLHLRSAYNLSFNQVSDLLGKNYRTIWTVYRRALKKIDSGITYEQ